MRSEENPLDLNNLPEDYSKDGKQVLEDTSSYAVGYRKKKSGAKDGKEEAGKVYECRFCSLKFCKSQALGGHMNRHRQERETETLNRARQLVFSSDSLLGQGTHPHHHLGGQPIPHGGYHHQTGNLAADPSMQFRSVYPTRLFSGTSNATLLPSAQPPQPPYMYSSPTRLVPFPSSHHYPATTSNHDYFLGHVVPANIASVGQAAVENTSTQNNYTCIGAPVNIGVHPHGFSSNYGGSDIGRGGEMASLYNQNHDHEGGLSWGRSCTAAGTTTQQQKQRFDSSSINRFQDGF